VVSGAPQGAPGVGGSAVFAETLAHADDNMILAQRLGEWISNAPDLELDIALGNIALDHLGVARALYTLAGDIEGEGRDEDDFAMLRSEREFTNLLLVEQPNGDFAHTIVRQVLFDTYQHHLWQGLRTSSNSDLAGIASRAHKESTYHLEFSGNWLARLGDGTDESHRRAQQAVDALWMFTAEMFDGPTAGLARSWRDDIDGFMADAGLSIPDDPYQKSGGRVGFHTEHLGHLLGEMQWLARSNPGANW
jgi:ring-1,2-phenylacetyl-CoA epoxidase subunit PaaC